MRICLIYDCLFPLTIGGAERWYRNLGERLAHEGHEVTYLTLRQWDEAPDIPGIEVIAVGPRLALYRGGKRRLLPPLRFGLGVLGHLFRDGKEYDVVHTASFPFFSLLAAGLVRRRGGYTISCDWHEVWTKKYWNEYLGFLGFIGAIVQSACAKVPQKAYTFSKLHADRLSDLGMRSVTQLKGQFARTGESLISDSPKAPLTVLYAGRFIPEKRVELLVDALIIAQKAVSDLRADLLGDGPTRSAVLAQIDSNRSGNTLSCPGFVDAQVLDKAMRSALCVVQPSRREGYGMVVIEATSRGVPAIVIAGEDNAATELIVDGVNGFIVNEADPVLLARAIVECVARGPELRSATMTWYLENRDDLSIEHSLGVVVQDYKGRALATV